MTGWAGRIGYESIDDESVNAFARNTPGNESNRVDGTNTEF